MKAFITGISGQDGSYLAEYLLGLGYEVFGIIRRNSTPEHQENRISGLNITTYYGDVLDSNIEGILREVQPDEIYNLAAQSHVRISFDIPQYTAETNAIGVLNLLNAYKNSCPDAKFYQASSSEMFGNSVDADGFQRLTTPMKPVSPYGCAKLFGFNIVNTYRESYGLHCKSGILFNHESPRRASNFVTMKVIKQAIEISKGKADKLVLGNLDSSRDWGHSKDYVKAIHLINQQTENVMVATGETNTIRELCKIVFGYFNMDYRDFVIQDKKYFRPNELNYLKGDNSQIKALGWQPEYTFERLIIEMMESCL